MAAYDKTKIPAAVPNRVESMIVFFILLFRRLMGNLTVVEQAGEIPTPAVLVSEVDATDGNKYLILRTRLRVASDYLDVGQAAWVSTPDNVTPTALPAGYGGV